MAAVFPPVTEWEEMRAQASDLDGARVGGRETVFLNLCISLRWVSLSRSELKSGEMARETQPRDRLHRILLLRCIILGTACLLASKQQFHSQYAKNYHGGKVRNVMNEKRLLVVEIRFM